MKVIIVGGVAGGVQREGLHQVHRSAGYLAKNIQAAGPGFKENAITACQVMSVRLQQE